MRNGIKESIKDITYKNGARVTTVEKVITKADDCAEIGNLYYRLSDLYHRSNADITDEERAVIEKETAEIKAKIVEFAKYLDGYEK